MKSKILKLAAYFAATTFSLSAMADQITIGEPGFGGNGCPQGTVSVTMSPDNSAVSILFDDYVVEAGGNQRRLARKSCNIAIPVNIPQGFSVAVYKVDYRGYASIPRGGRGKFSAQYFYAGQRGPRLSKNFRGGYDDEYIFTNKLIGHNLVWSACGATTNLRANTSMLVKTNRRRAEALATVDSADIEAGLIYHFKWRRCR